MTKLFRDVRFEAIKELAFGSISGTYAAIGTTENAIRILILTNLTDVALYVSFDGTTNHLRIPANGFKLLDLTTNQTASVEDGKFLSARSVIYAKSVSGNPTTGVITAECIY